MTALSLTSSPKFTNCKTIFDPHNNARRVLDVIELIASSETISLSGIIIGNYGYGKTHLLFYLYNKVYEIYDQPFVIYSNSPKNGILDLYLLLVNNTISIGNKIIDYLDEPLKTAYKALLSEDNKDKLYINQWIRGESIPLRIRQKYGLGKTIGYNKALEYSIQILHALYKTGFNPILILLDEVEDILLYNTIKKIRYLSHLRTLIDYMPPHTLLLLSSTPAGFTEIINNYPALSRRLSAFTIYLKPFTENETRGFIEYYLTHANMKLDCLLDDEVVKIIHEYSEGNPGEIVRILNIIYLYLSKRKEKNIVDAEAIKEVLSEYV